MRLTVRTGSRPASVPSKILATLFLSLFLGAGLFMAWFIGRGVYRTVSSYSWPETSCRILESRVARESGSNPYVFHVRFRYEAGGRAHESTVYKSTYNGSEQVTDAERLVERYPVDSEATCYVDPAAPEKAYLARASLWSVLVLLFPAVFILVGAGGIVLTWTASATAAAEAAGDAALSEGERKAPSTRMALGCLIAFLSIFAFAGLGTGLFFIVPAWKSFAARSWPQVDCTVIASAVRSHPGSKSTTYNVDILYEYEVGGRTHRSNRYEFLGGSSGGYGAKEDIVRQNPPGLRRKCYVNPSDPTDAVLSIAFGKQYLPAIVPAVFLLAGFGGIAFVLKAARSRATTPATFGADGRFVTGAADATPGLAAASGPTSGPVTLKTASPVGKLFGMIFVTLFWNGILSAFLWQVVVQWKQGSRPWGLMLFLTPFVVVGLALLFGVVYTFLGLFNPRPRLELSRGSIPLGTSASLRWSFGGATSRITRLEIRLEGREEARYRRGTSTFTDRNTFLSIPIFDSPETDRIREGSARVAVPADTMHSFSAANNKILWKLKFQGSIPRWPDVLEELDVLVEPSGGSRAS